MIADRDLATLHLQQLIAFRRAGVKRVCVRGSELGDECRACRALHFLDFAIDEAPVLPPRRCRCKRGCKCRYLAARETPPRAAE